ncbi:hypothetical protein [Streptomyces cadmiisoli]|uniref:hypothetical protein n=1 Tax=Streptomyces cadmiisoli TaxID=2184053 RepID=UPI003663721F
MDSRNSAFKKPGKLLARTMYANLSKLWQLKPPVSNKLDGRFLDVVMNPEAVDTMLPLFEPRETYAYCTLRFQRGKPVFPGVIGIKKCRLKYVGIDFMPPWADPIDSFAVIATI